MSKNINNTFNNTIRDLDGIANIRFGDLWNTSNSSPEKNTYWTSFKRTFWYSNEDRRFNLLHIETLIDGAFNLMELMYNEYIKMGEKTAEEITQKADFLASFHELQQHIIDAQIGIANLRGHYKNDKAIIKTIDGIIDKIKHKYVVAQSEYKIKSVIYYIPV